MHIVHTGRFRRPKARVAIRALVAIAAVIIYLFPATPTSAADPIDPSGCTVAPRTRAELIDLVGSAEAGPATPATPAQSAADPMGSDTLRSIEATIEMSLACTNANQPLAALALFTDRYVAARFGADGGSELGHLLAASTRTPPPAAPADRLTLVSISDVSVLADGRIAVTVTTSNQDATFTDRLALVPMEYGDWLIDEVVALDPPATPVVGSPVADRSAAS